MEVRGGEYSFRRRQGRRDLRPEEDVAGRAGANDAALYGGDHRVPGAGKGRARAGCEHQRANHGVDHGHLLDAHAADGHGGGDGQATEHRRVARAARGDWARHHGGLRRGVEVSGHPARGLPCDRPGLRECGFERGAADAGARLQNYRDRRVRRRAVQSQRN